ncbi:MAG: RNA methyltransferase [Clostridiales bacterium]|jgi:TrmH family RNA methyltransferase|nr:RNA methyltransferase [Clostridiales bacterium]
MIIAGAEFVKKLKKLDGQLFIVEGEKFVKEIPSSWEVKYYVITEEFASGRQFDHGRHDHRVGSFDLRELETRAKVYITRKQLFSKISQTENPQGILAVCGKREFALDFAQAQGLWLLCEDIQDPGNLGTLIRAAGAAGAGGVILCGACCDVYNPKVVRASAGGVFRVPVIKAPPDDIVTALRDNHINIIAAVVRDGSLPYTLDMRGSCCVMIGNEAQGLSSALTEAANFRARLPMVAAESLNAAVAGAVLLYEAVRQRISI